MGSVWNDLDDTSQVSMFYLMYPCKSDVSVMSEYPLLAWYNSTLYIYVCCHVKIMPLLTSWYGHIKASCKILIV